MRKRGIALVLAVLFIALPRMALGVDGVRIYDLTEMYGVQSADDVFFLDRDRLFVVSVHWSEDYEIYPVEIFYLSLKEKQPLFRYSFEHACEDGWPSSRLVGETLRIITCRPDEIEPGENPMDMLTIGVDGKPEWGTASVMDVSVDTMPGGAQIAEQLGSLYLKDAQGGQMKKLVSGAPTNTTITFYDEQLYNFFFAAIDENRFLYRRWGWEEAMGYGLYDLRSDEDWLISEEGEPRLVLENKLYTTTEIVDLETRARVPLPEIIVDWPTLHEGYAGEWYYAPDGGVMCCFDYPFFGADGLFLYDVTRGEMKGYWKADNLTGSPSSYFYLNCAPYFPDPNTLALCGSNDQGHTLMGIFQLDQLTLEPMPQ